MNEHDGYIEIVGEKESCICRVSSDPYQGISGISSMIILKDEIPKYNKIGIDPIEYAKRIY